MLSRHDVGTRQENQLTRNYLRNARLQSSQLAEPLRADPGVKKEIDTSELDSTKKQNKKAWQYRRTFVQNPRMRGKSYYNVL